MIERWFLHWEDFWADIPRVRLTGAIDCLYGLAILTRPSTGTTGMIAGWLDISGAWFGWLFLLFGLPALLRPFPAIAFIVFSVPLHLYTLAAILWVVLDKINPGTGIAANLAVLVLLYCQGMKIARGNHDG